MTATTRRLVNTAVSGVTFVSALLVVCPLLLIFGRYFSKQEMEK